MIALTVAVIDNGFDLGIMITRQERVFQQGPILEGLMSAFDLVSDQQMKGRWANSICGIFRTMTRLSPRVDHLAETVDWRERPQHPTHRSDAADPFDDRIQSDHRACHPQEKRII